MHDQNDEQLDSEILATLERIASALEALVAFAPVLRDELSCLGVAASRTPDEWS